MPKLLLPLAALVAIGGSAAGAGVYLATRGETVEEVPPPAAELQVTATPTATPETPAVKGTLWRWVNVTVVVPVPEPEGWGVYVFRTKSPLKPPSGGPVLDLIYSEESVAQSEMWIDAETGVVLAEDIRPQDRPLFEPILETLVVAPLDRATAPWPYNTAIPADLPRETADGISFFRPSPSTGLQLLGGIADPTGPFMGITNGRSSLTFLTDLTSRPLSFDFSNVLPEDREVIERWVSQVKICGVEVEC